MVKMETKKIQILSEVLAKQIAAGEVVERPASVVKELVENAVDARATSISIEVFDGGRKGIKIIDNGTGMTRDDAKLCIERHSTSKIKTLDELSNIRTLGFRGEALPSIASVSKMKITTLYQGETVGTELHLNEGKIKEIRDTGCPQGTTVEVNDLFYNTPARLKFLKSINTELSYISNIISQEALANPKIHFKLFHNGRSLMNAPSVNDNLERIAVLFGKKLAKEMVQVEARYNEIELNGHISKPAMTKSSRTGQHLFVNSRPVKDKTVTHAVYQAYRTFLPKGRNPLFFLFLDLNPEMVDVNVHPSKMEVKFRNQSEIHEFIEEFVRSRIMNGNGPERETAFLADGEIKEKKPADNHLRRPEPAYKERVFEAVSKYVSSPTAHTVQGLPLQPVDSSLSSLLFKPESVEEFRFVTQIDNSFLLFETGAGLLFVDQHVAHERIIFDKLLKDFKKSCIQIQSLLFSQTVELSPGESLILEEYSERFMSLGFDIEYLKGPAFMIRGIPAVLSDKNCEKALRDILERLVETGRVKSFDEMVEEILITMACHGAVKDNKPLKESEIMSLMEELLQSETPHTCPHGRPVMLVLRTEDLQKRFQKK